jgi:hypothetical protein
MTARDELDRKLVANVLGPVQLLRDRAMEVRL